MPLFSAAHVVLLAALATPPGSAAATPAAAKPTGAIATPAKASKAAPPKAKAKAHGKLQKKPRTTTVVLYHVNRRERMTLRQADMQGRGRVLQKRFDRFLRCHYTNKQHAMNPRLVRLLYQTGRHWPGRQIDVVSGFRNPTVAKNPHSPHMKGLACDFRVEGVKNTELRDYLRGNLKKVGVGYYPNSSFVHLDVRKDRSAFWIDYSGPGERSMYSENPGEDLKSGRAETYKPTKIEDDFINDAPSDRPAEGTDTKSHSGPDVQGQALAGRPAGGT